MSTLSRKKAWLTYAWLDNEHQDIDFIISEISKHHDVLFDRKTLIAGQDFWAQIENWIVNPRKTDAWIIVFAAGSSSSVACYKEICYALDRAEKTRNNDFPIIALMHGCEFRELPGLLQRRLCISLHQTDWLTQLVAGLELRSSDYEISTTLPIEVIESSLSSDESVVLEFRPRFSAQKDLTIKVPIQEEKHVRFWTDTSLAQFRPGPRFGFVYTTSGVCKLEDGSDGFYWIDHTKVDVGESLYLEVPRHIIRFEVIPPHGQRLIFTPNFGKQP